MLAPLRGVADPAPGRDGAVDLGDARAVGARDRGVRAGDALVAGRGALHRADDDHDLDRAGRDGARRGRREAAGDEHEGDDAEDEQAKGATRRGAVGGTGTDTMAASWRPTVLG